MPPDTPKYQKQDTRQLAPEREHATETTVAARVSHSTKAALQQLAEQRGTDTSKLLRRLIWQELARAGDPQDPRAADVMRLTWSRNLPTERGIYFVRTWNPLRNKWAVSTAKVVQADDALQAHIAGWSDPQRVGTCSQGREWAGPIPQPKDSP